MPISLKLNIGIEILHEHFLKFGFKFENPFIILFAFSIYLVCEYSCKFNEALILQPIFSNLYLRYIILKD